MSIRFAKTFHKGMRMLSEKNQIRVLATLRVFEKDPFTPSLRNHKLQGVKKNLHSITAGYDLRLVYSEKDGHALVLFIDVGSHEEVYR